MIKFTCYIILLVCCFTVACKPNTTTEVEDGIVEEEQNIAVNSIGEQLSVDAKVLLADWKGFQQLVKKIEIYTSISSGQALENAKDLSGLIRKISDTIKIDVLERPDFRARLNVFYSHSLRLEDMAAIPSISEEEVNTQVTKLLDGFSSVNHKINAICREEKSEREFGNASETPDEIDNSEVKKEGEKPEKPSLVDPVNASQ